MIHNSISIHVSGIRALVLWSLRVKLRVCLCVLSFDCVTIVNERRRWRSIGKTDSGLWANSLMVSCGFGDGVRLKFACILICLIPGSFLISSMVA